MLCATVDYVKIVGFYLRCRFYLNLFLFSFAKFYFYRFLFSFVRFCLIPVLRCRFSTPFLTIYSLFIHDVLNGWH